MSHDEKPFLSTLKATARVVLGPSRLARLRRLRHAYHGVVDVPRTEIFGVESSHSQYGQEAFVQRVLFPGRRGYYVDVGARCGLVNSNTFRLEESGWDGVCIEPHPDLFRELQANRGRAWLFHTAVSDGAPGTLDFVKMLEEPLGNSGLRSTFSHPERLARMRHEIISVPVRPLTDLLDEAGAPSTIEYLDIDVEGHELEVLRGLDFGRYRFGAIGVEVSPGTGRYRDIDKRLRHHGYETVAQLGSDAFFLPAP